MLFYWSAAALEAVVARALDARGLERAGKKFSAKTMRCLREVHANVGAAHATLSTMLTDAPDENLETNADEPDVDTGDLNSQRAVTAPETATGDAEGRATRKAKAEALKARAAR